MSSPKAVAVSKASGGTSGPDVPAEMKAVVTRGHGGFEMLDYTQVKTPVLEGGDVLLKVLAAGVNNTEINTRLGWYSKTVKAATNEQSDNTQEVETGGWSGATPFPLIQGTDCCGEVVAASPGLSGLVGKRVLVRCTMRGPKGFASYENKWMASDFDGAFAQFVRVPGGEVFPVRCSWSDAELASIPCAYGTAENMVERARVGPESRVVVPGASGGVGSAVVQLCKRRGAHVTAICGPGKEAAIKELGADQVLVGRHGSPAWSGIVEKLRGGADVVIDNVGGPAFPDMLDMLMQGGRYATSGAISGPVVDLDLRTLYLKDLTLIGTTAWEECVMPNLVSYIEKGEIKPLVSGTFPLSEIVLAQQTLLKREHVGKLVLIPPPTGQ